MKLISLLTTLCLFVATTATAQEVNIRSMDEACRTDPALVDRCFVPPEGHTYIATIWEFSQEFAAAFGSDPEVVMQRIIINNKWDGANRDTIIPAGVAFILL